MKEYEIKASFTVEAAVVMPVVFITIAMLIKTDIKLHDIAVGNMAANEAAEIYERRAAGIDADQIAGYENDRLEKLFSGEEYVLNMEEHGDGSMVSISGGDGARTYTDSGYRPEKFMRKLTIIEEVADDR